MRKFCISFAVKRRVCNWPSARFAWSDKFIRLHQKERFVVISVRIECEMVHASDSLENALIEKKRFFLSCSYSIFVLVKIKTGLGLDSHRFHEDQSVEKP